MSFDKDTAEFQERIVTGHVKHVVRVDSLFYDIAVH